MKKDVKTKGKTFPKQKGSNFQIKYGNDIANYFNRINGLNGNAAKLSFYNPVGLETPTNFFANSGVSGVNAVAGILRIGFVPGPGYSADGNSSVNVASKGITAFLTSNIGRPYAYDPQDYMQYILSFESALLHLVKLSRAVGLIRTVSGENRYIPQNLVGDAIKFDVNDLRSHLPQARWLYTYYAQQLNKLNVPNQFTSFDWHIRMLSQVYRDQDNLKAQLYVLDSDTYYIYQEALGTMKCAVYPSSMTLAQWETIMNAMLRPLLNSQNLGNMSSDTIKAFGDKLFKAPTVIPDDYQVDIVKDENMLNMIHNITLVGCVDSAITGRDHFINVSSCDITQDPNDSSLLWKPMITIASAGIAGWIGNILESTLAIDMPQDNPSEDDVLAACVGKASFITSSSTTGYIIPAVTDFFTTAHIISMTAANAGLADVGQFFVQDTINDILIDCTEFSEFDWAPKLAVTYFTGSFATPTYGETIQLWEINNYTMLSRDILRRIGDGALASVYNIPEIGDYH